MIYISNQVVYSEDFCIFGTGGLGKEILGWMKSDKKLLSRLKFFVDDNTTQFSEYQGIKVVNSEFLRQNPLPYVLAIGSATGRFEVSQELSRLGLKPLNYIHRSVIIGCNVDFGLGNVILPNSTLSSNVKIGNFNLINVGSGVGHDVVMGDYNVLLGAVSLNGNVIVGSSVTLGAGARIFPGLKIGDSATVAMAAAVFTNVKPSTTVFGNPAKTLRV